MSRISTEEKIYNFYQANDVKAESLRRDEWDAGRSFVCSCCGRHIRHSLLINGKRHGLGCAYTLMGIKFSTAPRLEDVQNALAQADLATRRARRDSALAQLPPNYASMNRAALYALLVSNGRLHRFALLIIEVLAGFGSDAEKQGLVIVNRFMSAQWLVLTSE